MSDSHAVAALQTARTTIERHLLAAFSRLDCETPHADVRKALYADLIRQAIALASERFPDDGALAEMIGKIFGDPRLATQPA